MISFYTTCIALIFYFIFFRRIIDYSLLALLSAVIYFMPGFFGYTRYHINGTWIESPLLQETYLVFIFVLFSIFIFSIANDFLTAQRPHGALNNQSSKKETGTEIHFILALSVLSLGMLWLEAGPAILNPDKAVAMESLGRWHILFYSTAMIGFPLSIAFKKNKIAIIFFTLLIFNTYIGFRSNIAISIMASIIFSLSGKKINIKTITTYGSAAMIFAFFMFFYKTVGYAVKAGMWDLVLERILNGETYQAMISNSEPFITQSILNEVISSDFRTPIDHIYSAAYQFIFFSSSLGADTTSFNDYFQPILFGDVNYGMASNIWAQMWSAGDWTLLAAMIFLFNIVILLGNRTLRSRNRFVSAGLAPIFCYWSFYIHRNDLGYTINLGKRIFIVLAVSVVFIHILKKAGGYRATH